MTISRMTPSQVPLIVLTKRQDDVELINSTLRAAGHAVHCHWVQHVDALAEVLQRSQPQLLWFFTDGFDASVRDVSRIRQQAAPMVPVVAVSHKVDEVRMTAAMSAGAQDLVSPKLRERLRAVAERELRAYRLERALNETLQSASQYKTQLKAFMAGSVDAIAYVHEGIVVEANQAWAKLLGHETPEALHGPLMDLFDTGSHAALRGALGACAKGQWDDEEPLKVSAVMADGSTLPLKLRIESSNFEGEPAVKLSVRREQAERSEPEELVERAVNRDPTTGFYHRRRFVELLTERLEAPPRSGVRALAYVRPDKFSEIQDEVGPLASEEILTQLAEVLRSLMQPHDVAGCFGGLVFAILLHRGTLRDIEAWAENAVGAIADHIFEVEQNTLSITCTIGLAELGPATERVDVLVSDAEKANQRGRQRGGNQVVLEETSDESTRVKRLDDVWLEQIKNALRENRFRIAHLPVVSLTGEQLKLYDTLVRMVDPQGEEVRASEFMPVAGRNRMLKAIDRWVVGASMKFCAEQLPDRVFVKLSKESLIDPTFLDWLAQQLTASGADASRLCFQASEEDVTQHLKQTRTLSEQLRARGFSFAVEHFGIGRDPGRVMAQTPMQYVKIDGSLMQSLATNQALQEKVRGFIKAAEKRKIKTIAERVEDANTMAVLFQLGASYMQGHYVHEPEVVLG
jgi:multidomain signaling protein FimX